LVGRPLSKLGRCPLGRETAIAEVEWKDDHWLYLKTGGKVPQVTIALKGHEATKADLARPIHDDFDDSDLSIHFQSLRIPIEEDWLTLDTRQGFLRLYGQESLSSFHYQSLIARSVQAFHIEATTCIEFSPKSFQQMAGLVCYYNTGHWFYLHLLGGDIEQSHTAPFDKYLQLTTCDNFEETEHLVKTKDLSKVERVFLKVAFDRGKLQFYYAIEENNWQVVAEDLDGSILSDDYVRDNSNRYRPAFTGAFVGLCCQDLTGQKHYADFDWFNYKELR
jgi:xylan 1,4-beta-xylosidase